MNAFKDGAGDAPLMDGGMLLSTLPTTRREILLKLKTGGELRAEDLATALGITVSGVRQHLSAMAAAGLVRHHETKDGPGRPKFTYVLTEAAESLFPRGYAELTRELLISVEEEDPELVTRLFERRLRRRVQRAKARIDGLDFRGKVAELTRMLDEEGYLAAMEEHDDGTFELVEHNCAVPAIAERFAPVCLDELEMLRTALDGAVVERVSHITSGGHACRYVIRER